jgi:hypothetical protein
MGRGDDPRLEFIKLLIRAGVSGVILIAAGYVILSDAYPDATEKWAFGAIGIVLGYWLR